MDTLTIILAIYVALDIITSTALAIILKGRGYPLRNIAWQILCALRSREAYDWDDNEEREAKGYINGYLYDALTDGSAYAEEWLDELEECGSRE